MDHCVTTDNKNQYPLIVTILFYGFAALGIFIETGFLVMVCLKKDITSNPGFKFLLRLVYLMIAFNTASILMVLTQNKKCTNTGWIMVLQAVIVFIRDVVMSMLNWNFGFKYWVVANEIPKTFQQNKSL